MTDSRRRRHYALWRNEAFKVYFTLLTVLVLLMFGSFMWSFTQYRTVRGMIDEQRATIREQEHLSELMARLVETDGKVIVEGRYDEALADYTALLDSLPPNLRSTVRGRMERLNSVVRDRLSGESDTDTRDLLLDQYRRTIMELETRSAQLQGRMARMSDSLENRMETMLADMSRKESELGRKERVQVITFNSTKGPRIHYLGEVRDGKAWGGGVGIWSTGSLYRGDWRNNLRHGQGSFEWVDGERYEGTYVNDIREGKGTYHWPSGERYEGQWKNDRRNGQGTLFDMDGNVRFKGDWKDDKPL